MSISFSGGAFNGFDVTAPYGQYSPPESIASHLAALITQKYYTSGLTADSWIECKHTRLGRGKFPPDDFSASGMTCGDHVTTASASQNCLLPGEPLFHQWCIGLDK